MARRVSIRQKLFQLGLQSLVEYELVVKFWRKSLKDEAFLATIQNELKGVLGETAELNGYDVSENEINLFVFTSDTTRAFRRIKRVLEDREIVQGVSAGWRLVGGAKFKSIWPSRPMRPFKLP
jgi:hypothetical protein